MSRFTHGTLEGYRQHKYLRPGKVLCTPCKNAFEDAYNEHKFIYKIPKPPTQADCYTTQQILDLYGSDCHICHEPIDMNAPRKQGRENWEFGLHLDHVTPLFLGGENSISNVKPSHGMCNLRKGGGVDALD